MIEPLTPEWLRQLGAVTGAIAADPAVSLVIQQMVEGDPPLRWHVVIAGGSVDTVRGTASDPAMTLSTDRDTAIGIATAQISAQRAFLEGKLRIAGRINALIEARTVLEEISDALREARTSENFTDPTPPGIADAAAGTTQAPPT